MKLSIIIPCFNESSNIPLILDEYSKFIKSKEVEIILVNNGSTDETTNLLDRIGANYKFLKIVKVDINQGYGFGVLSGLKTATGEYIGWTHGDMQTPPRDIIKVLEIIDSNYPKKNIFIKGNRCGRPIFDKFFTWGMNIFETLYLKTWLTDINAQPNVFHRSFFERWQNPPTDFSLDLYAYYKARKEKFKIIRFNVQFLKRIHGESHWNKDLLSKWKFIKRTVSFSLDLKRNIDNV